ncbi:septum formation initiator family protein [uncultured Psychroserpens sp.]|uniref:FtsB family cell division protein n=1 Tax=uncultured Psychroserpens sp. TaxID=255436 RepID=UPI00262F0939|nr:septum formation initiator family protein [uncultured Psychroserpens sp.]
MLKYFKNIFVIVFIVFAFWMLFIDSNSLLIHNELNNDISDLEAEKEYYKKEIEKDKKAIKELSTEDGIEKLAREKYYMKKDNEDIYIIEYEDSLKLEKKDE